jgi:hypothetical protein
VLQHSLDLISSILYISGPQKEFGVLNMMSRTSIMPIISCQQLQKPVCSSCDSGKCVDTWRNKRHQILCNIVYKVCNKIVFYNFLHDICWFRAGVSNLFWKRATAIIAGCHLSCSCKITSGIPNLLNYCVTFYSISTINKCGSKPYKITWQGHMQLAD